MRKKPYLAVVVLVGFGVVCSAVTDFIGNNGANWDTSGSITATASSSHSRNKASWDREHEDTMN